MPERMWQRGPDGEVVRSPRKVAGTTGDAARSEGAATTDPVAPRKRARLGLALRLGLRDTYDFLGSVLLLSVGCAVIAAAAALGGQSVGIALFRALPAYLPVFMSVLLAIAGLVLVGGPLAAGLFRFARNVAARQEPELFDLSWGYRHALRRSIGLASLQAVGFLVLAANCYFYSSQRHPLPVVLGAVFGYALVFWGTMSLYHWPLLAEQEIPAVRIIKKSFLLVLDNFAYSLILGLLFATLSVLFWMTMVGGALLWAGTAAMLLTQASRELLRKYDVLPPDPTLDPIAGETHEFGGHGWHE